MIKQRTQTWVKERTEATIPFTYPIYCPINLETGIVKVGLSYVGEPVGLIVGEFWYEEGEIIVHLVGTKI